MLRALALLYSLCSISYLVLAAMNGTMAGVWARFASMFGVLVLAGYTTFETVKGFLLSMKGKGCG